MERSEVLRHCKLSIVVTVYNNDKFIERCINTIISQKADFPFEILIGDDASTDQTLYIAEKLKKKYPEIIKLFKRKSNIGTSRNFLDLVYRAQGEYIAQVDGDDFISSPMKLQIQTDFLDNNQQCSICFHHYTSQNAKGEALTQSPRPFNSDTIADLSLLLRTTMGPGNTTMFRKSALPQTPPQWLLDSGNHKDFALQFMIACKGKIGFINQDLSIYTKHENSITRTEKTETLFRNSITINEGLLKYQRELGLKEHLDTFRWIVNARRLRLAFYHLNEGNLLGATKCFLNSMQDPSHVSIQLIKDAMFEGAPKLANKLTSIKKIGPRI